MTSSFLSDRQQGSLSYQGAPAVIEASKEASHAAQGEPVATPHAAVEAALSAAETLSKGAGSAVSINFQVGDNDLSVRVELRNGEVHATFRTDSADLRQELAREWQSVGPGSQSLPIAPAVITSSGASHDSLDGGGGNHPGRGRESEASQGSPSFQSRNQPAASSAAVTAPAAPSALPTSVHLLTFA